MLLTRDRFRLFRIHSPLFEFQRVDVRLQFEEKFIPIVLKAKLKLSRPLIRRVTHTRLLHDVVKEILFKIARILLRQKRKESPADRIRVLAIRIDLFETNDVLHGEGRFDRPRRVLFELGDASLIRREAQSSPLVERIPAPVLRFPARRLEEHCEPLHRPLRVLALTTEETVVVRDQMRPFVNDRREILPTFRRGENFRRDLFDRAPLRFVDAIPLLLRQIVENGAIVLRRIEPQRLHLRALENRRRVLVEIVFIALLLRVDKDDHRILEPRRKIEP